MRDRGTLSRALSVLTIAALVAFGAALVTAGPVLADDSSQLPDISAQIRDMQNQLAQLQAKGQTGKTSQMAALADCGYGPDQQTFSRWGDPAEYALAPDGDLSDMSRWYLKDVQTSPNHDPYTSGTGSLIFNKADSEAVSPVTCVNLDNPTMRVFTSDLGGNGKTHLNVTLVYQGLDGSIQQLTVATLLSGSSWQPSVTIPVPVGILAAANSSGWVPVAFDFKVTGLQKNETYSLDGIWVDPCRSH